MTKLLRDIYKNKLDLAQLFIDYRINQGHKKDAVKHSKYDLSKFTKN